MSEYLVMFYMKLSAKSKKDLERKAESVGEVLSKAVRKSVYPHGYVELEKSDVPSIQEKLM